MIFQVKEKRKAEVEDKFLQQSLLKSTFKLSSSHFQKPFILSDCTKVESSKSPVKQNCWDFLSVLWKIFQQKIRLVNASQLFSSRLFPK